MSESTNSFGAKDTLTVGDQSYEIYRIDKVEGSETLPFSLKVLLENLLRTEDGANITADQIRALGGWDENAQPDIEIQFTPARVIMQDFTGVPCVVDLATMREAVADLGDHTVDLTQVDPEELGRPLLVESGVGRLRVIVPDEIDVTATGRVGLGSVEVFGSRSDDPGAVVGNSVSGPSDTELDLSVQLGAGDVEIIREGAQ